MHLGRRWEDEEKRLQEKKKIQVRKTQKEEKMGRMTCKQDQETCGG